MELTIPQSKEVAVFSQSLKGMASANSLIAVLKCHGRSVYEVNQAMYALFMCEKKAGLELDKLAPHGGSKIDVIKLEKLGVMPWQSARWRKIAQIHDEDIRVYCEESQDAVTRGGIIKRHKESITAPPEQDFHYYLDKMVYYGMKATALNVGLESQVITDFLKGVEEMEERPLKPDRLKYYLERKAKIYDAREATTKQRGLLAGMLTEALSGDTNGRYAVCTWLTGESSSSDIPDEMVCAMLDWIGPEKIDGRYVPNEFAIKEAQSVLVEALKDQGQMELI